MAGTVFIACGAFWLSFTSLADLARRSGIDPAEAWAWPLIVDGIIVVATVAVVALAGSRTAWYPWVLLAGGALVSVTANALHAVVAADATVPGVLAACVAAVPPVVLLAITHLTVILTRRPETVPDEAVPDAWAEPAQKTVDGTVRAGMPKLTAASPRDRAAELRGQGWSNRRIALELDVHPSTVGRWLTNTSHPDTSAPAVAAHGNEMKEATP
ncbi:DUF2637 domain-containing protein [Humibacter ginsenosidimutans]|uniref:DUF2637 domain-containing protein n=1 Tax=Humibacter ginsenosidimutans TaxID=2599293 RepID=UPI003F5D341C